MKNILVSGGLGYIGSHTVVELQKAGFNVVIIDDLSNSKISVLDGITKITNIKPEYAQIDLKNKKSVHDFFESHNIDGCIHFAAYKAVGESQKKPLEYYENNINSLLNLLFEFKERNLDNFIFSSSCTVYGQADKMPIDETAPIKPAESAYGSTKQMNETILADYSKAYNKKVELLRYFNPIGAHPSALIGELPIGVPNNLVPYITQTAVGIREKLSIFGNDYNTPDGTCIRDYIYVVDLAKAHVCALHRLLNNQNKSLLEFFNLGTGQGYSVLEVVKAFEQASGEKLNYQFVPRRSGDITTAFADTSLAEKELGWKAETPLIESLRTAFNWEKHLQNI